MTHLLLVLFSEILNRNTYRFWGIFVANLPKGIVSYWIIVKNVFKCVVFKYEEGVRVRKHACMLLQLTIPGGGSNVLTRNVS